MGAGVTPCPLCVTLLGVNLRLSTKQWGYVAAAGVGLWLLLRGSKGLPPGITNLPPLSDLFVSGSEKYAQPYLPFPILSLASTRTVDNDPESTPGVLDRGYLMLTSKLHGFGFLGRFNENFPLYCNGTMLSGINGHVCALAATVTFAELVRAGGVDIELSWPSLAPPSLSVASYGGFSSEWTRESWPEDGVSGYLRGMEANCRVLSPNGNVYQFIDGIASETPIGHHQLVNPRIDWKPVETNLLWVAEGWVDKS